MNNKSGAVATNLIPTVIDEPKGYIYPGSHEDDGGWDLNPNELNPNYVTGFTDAEGCFCPTIFKVKASKIGWTAQLFFSISLKKADKAILDRIQCFFGVGKIKYEKNNDAFTYCVSNMKDLREVIIPHFLKYPLITQKQADFELFKSVAELINKKEHLTIEGLQKIVNIRASINLGLSDVLKTAFPNLDPVLRPKVEATENPDPNWLAGFIDGEGCFYIGIYESKKYKAGACVQLRFSISQHSRDAELMRNIVNALGCGRLQEHQKKSAVEFVVTDVWGIVEKIIPYFDKYPLCKEGLKMLDYKDFCEVVELIREEAHLTEEGLNKIRKIKSDMRIRRIKSAGVDKENIETIKNNVKPRSTVVKVVNVYNKDKSVLLKTFPSVNAFMSFSKQSGYNVKLLCTTGTLWLGEYFLSYDLIASADNSLANSVFNPVLRNRTTSIPVYTYSADGNTFIKRYSSLRECVKVLDGNRNTNTSSLELRIEHKELYHGLRVSHTPLFDHD